jgi:aminoglycoside phosphotransferase (APT) family kinase protein
MTTAPTTRVPASREELLDADWLLAHLDDLHEGDEIVRIEPTETSKTRAEKLRFAVTVRTPEGLRVRFYCAKAHLDGSPSSGITSEARFYRDLAPRLDVRRPRVPYVAIEPGGDAAIIVMEDIVAAGGLFMNPHRPLSVDVTRETLSQLAHLHATTWDLASVGDIDWLGPGRASIGGMYSAPMLQSLLDDGRADGLPAELRNGANLVAALDLHGQHPITCVLHGDTHTGNVYLDADGRGSFFDWEVVQVGNWAQDVAYHLGSVLRIDDRRAYERELIREYLTELAAHGAPAPDFDEGYELYRRSFTYGYLLWVITQIRGRDEVLAHMPRLAAAMSDHDVYRRLGVL